MTDDDRLRRKIEKLAAETPATGPHGREIASADGDIVGAILDEIDETILGRSLRFRNGAGAVVVLEAAGRRLLRVAEAPGAGAPLTDPLGEDAAPQIAALRDCLAAFAAGSGPLHVLTAPLGRRADPSNVGRSADALRAVLRAEPGAAAETPPPADASPAGADDDAFLAALSGRDWARFDSEGNVAETSAESAGTGALTPELIAAVAAELAGPDDERAGKALALAGGAGRAVFVGFTRQGAIAVAGGRDALPALFTAWQRRS